jgi:hypothetical protein
MTEHEWLTSPYDDDVLEYLRQKRKVSARKLRLFCCALVRKDSEWIRVEWGRHALEIAERFADGQATRDQLKTAHQVAYKKLTRGALSETTAEEVQVSIATKGAMWAAFPDVWYAAARFVKLPEYRGDEAEYLRDVVGNPFRRVGIDPAWLSWGGGTVRDLARSIYHDRAFDRTPILADALEEAGCTDADILDHCRGPGPHVRGCWVVDLLLGKQ